MSSRWGGEGEGTFPISFFLIRLLDLDFLYYLLVLDYMFINDLYALTLFHRVGGLENVASHYTIFLCCIK